jgi:alpha/beta superfamily hydrolase
LIVLQISVPDLNQGSFFAALLVSDTPRFPADGHIFSVEFLAKTYQNKCIVSTKRLVIQAQVQLEAVLREGSGKGGVVICHPHPLYGGSMENGVVEAIADGFHRSGFTTVKFNFRGVGRSSGRFADGIGETDDVLAAYGFLKEHLGGEGRLLLAGYSFGAWVSGLTAARIPEPIDLFLVAYPFSAYSPGELSAFQGRIYLVGGSRDEIAPVDDLLSFYKALQCEKYLKIIPCSHFFEGREMEISDFIFLHFGEKGE